MSRNLKYCQLSAPGFLHEYGSDEEPGCHDVRCANDKLAAAEAAAEQHQKSAAAAEKDRDEWQANWVWAALLRSVDSSVANARRPWHRCEDHLVEGDSDTPRLREEFLAQQDRLRSKLVQIAGEKALNVNPKPRTLCIASVVQHGAEF